MRLSIDPNDCICNEDGCADDECGYCAGLADDEPCPAEPLATELCDCGHEHQHHRVGPNADECANCACSYFR